MKNLKQNLLEKKEMNEVRGGSQVQSSVYWCQSCPCSKSKEGRCICYGRQDAKEQGLECVQVEILD